VGLDLTKSAVLPAIVELSGDEEGAVRLAAVETVVHLLSLLDDEVCSGTIVPLVMRSCEQARSSEDCSLPAIVRHLGRLCHGLTPNLRQEEKEENLKRGICAVRLSIVTTFRKRRM
jgi:serine/threonine-protein phosphatase 4 regulatory subunit 4